MNVRKLDEARRPAVQAAQQVDRIGEIASGMNAGGLEERIEMAMARTAAIGDAREVSLGDADR
jgi:hypothetical protein